MIQRYGIAGLVPDTKDQSASVRTNEDHHPIGGVVETPFGTGVIKKVHYHGMGDKEKYVVDVDGDQHIFPPYLIRSGPRR